MFQTSSQDAQHQDDALPTAQQQSHIKIKQDAKDDRQNGHKMAAGIQNVVRTFTVVLHMALHNRELHARNDDDNDVATPILWQKKNRKMAKSDVSDKVMESFYFGKLGHI